MSEFDPRFDPAFQRGYENPVPVRPKTADASPAAAPRPHLGPAETAGSAAPAARSEELAGDTESRPDFDLEDERRRANPFLIALVAVAALLVVAGVGLVSQTQSITESATNNYDYVLAQTLMIGSPIAIGLGLATGVGVLFLFALRWRR